MSATRIGVVGAGGRMGRMLIEATLKDDQLALGAAFEVSGSPFVGKTAGELVGMSCDVLVTEDVAAGEKYRLPDRFHAAGRYAASSRDVSRCRRSHGDRYYGFRC